MIHSLTEYLIIQAEMEDKMEFPDEIWVDDDGRYYVDVRLTPEFLESAKRYIRADLVPVSCGGTMEPVVTSGYSVVKAPDHKWVQESLAGGTMEEYNCVSDKTWDRNRMAKSERRRRRAPETVDLEKGFCIADYDDHSNAPKNVKPYRGLPTRELRPGRPPAFQGSEEEKDKFAQIENEEAETL